MTYTAEQLQAALRRCSEEPIQLAGAIQPYGVLLALDDANFIRMASANVRRYFHIGADDLIGRSVSYLIGAAAAHQLAELPVRGELQPSVQTVLDMAGDGLLNRMPMTVQVHRSGGLLILEIEPVLNLGDSPYAQHFNAIREALWQLDAKMEVGHFAQHVSDQVRRLTGFDRVKVYRFDHHWNGEVIAEARNERLPSLLGNHFPASDIPPQARALYARNLVRVLADRDAPPEPVLPAANPLTGQPLDMSFSVLRAMSPIHIEYVRNMEVRSTITISIMVGERLWGMIACHNAAAVPIPFSLREICEFIGKTVSLRLASIEATDRQDYAEKVRQTLVMLTSMIRETGEIGQLLRLMESEVLAMVGASGCVITIGNQRYLAGATPSPEDLATLSTWVRTQLNGDKIYFTDHLAAAYPAAAAWTDTVAGLLAVTLDQSFTDHILWFRREVVREIPWAGDMDKTVTADDAGIHIQPRRSFAVWMQTSRGYSRPWSITETDAAYALSLSLVEVLVQKALRVSEQNYRLLAEHSTDLISRHDSDGRFLFASPASRDLLGIGPMDLIGQNLFDLTHPEDRPNLRDAFARAVTQPNTPETIIYRCQTGIRTLWLESTIKPVDGDAPGCNSAIIVNSRNVTERHEYQLAVQEMRKRNEAILESAGEGILGLDRAGRITFANSAACRMLGYRLDALLHRDAYATVRCCQDHGGSPTPAACPIAACLTQGEIVQSRDDSFEREDGTRFAVDFIVTPIQGESAVDGAVVVFRDITELRRTEDRLRQSNTVFENAAEAIMMMDAKGHITAVNQAFTDITGYSQPEVLGQPANILKSGRHSDAFYRELWRQVTENKSWRGEIWNRRKNGEIYPQWGSTTAVLDEDGRIRNFVTVFADISRLKKTEAELKHLASHDPLTQLPNRNLLNERLHQALVDADEHRHRVALLFIDLDHFKVINDTLGHGVGDGFLRQVAQRLREVIRRDDTLARWGGDEFVIVMNRIGSAEQVAERTEHILRTLAEPVTVEGHEMTPSASVGIAIYPTNGDDASRLVQAADTAVYRAKHLGRNRFEFFTHELTEEIERRFRTGWEIRRALAQNEFIVHYQPQCASGSGRVVGLEALVRWQHPERGLLPPADFLPMTEELGLISRLGDCVLGLVCQDLIAWGNRLPAGIRVAVNVAPAQVMTSFVGSLRTLIEQSGIDPARLELEITEGALEHRDDVRDVLSGLCELGISLSIDDFGTGYSSLSHLREFPVSCLKIDKSFVDGLPHDHGDVAIVRTIIALGNSLEMQIVAEGVERPDQLDLLRRLGVPTIQGFHFSRPLPAAQALAYILDRRQ